MTPRRLACIGLAATAVALGSAAQADPRITDRAYHERDIITLRGGPGIESTIAFAPDERIENIAVGDSAAWHVTPNRRANLLFVKPATARARTNMTVVTDQRTYLFDLVSGAAGSAVYMLRFTYPDGPRPTPNTGATATVELAASPPPKPVAEPLALNFAWRAKGEKTLLPASFFDDGKSTFLRWGKDDTLPAILSRGPNGAEGPVNFTVQGDYIVVEGVPPQLLLRSGKHLATLTPDPRRAPVAPATASAKLTSQGGEARP